MFTGTHGERQEVLFFADYEAMRMGNNVWLSRKDPPAKDILEKMLIRAEGEPPVYLVKSGRRYWIRNWTCLKGSGYSRRDLIFLPDQVVHKIPKATVDIHTAEQVQRLLKGDFDKQLVPQDTKTKAMATAPTLSPEELAEIEAFLAAWPQSTEGQRLKYQHEAAYQPLPIGRAYERYKYDEAKRQENATAGLTRVGLVVRLSIRFPSWTNGSFCLAT